MSFCKSSANTPFSMPENVLFRSIIGPFFPKTQLSGLPTLSKQSILQKDKKAVLKRRPLSQYYITTVSLDPLVSNFNF